MPVRSTGRIPKYRLHKASKRAVVTLNGRVVYLGPYGTEESRAEYDRVVGEYLANGRRLPMHQAEGGQDGLTISELLAAYLRHARTFYLKDGKVTSEVDCIRCAARPLRRLYGLTPAAGFGPLALKTVRQELINSDLSRKTVNGYVSRIKHMFKWAVANEIVLPSVYDGLSAVEGLREGRCDARETEPVHPVPDSMVDAVRPFVSRQVWAIIELMRLTGARCGEIVIMRACDLDMSGAVWQYRPASHKTQHHGKRRTIDLGPKAQDVIRLFLKPDFGACLFSAADAVAEHRAEQRRNRKTRVQPSQRDRSKRNPKHRPGEHFTTDSLRRSITNACDAAYPPPEPLGKRGDETEAEWRKRLTEEQMAELAHWRRAHRWHPHQLRHSFATRIRREYGIEAARILLGHSSIATSELYAEIDRERVKEVAAKVG